MNEQEVTQQNSASVLCHALSFVGFVFPFGNILAPLIAWQSKRGLGQYADRQGKEAVNFQITITIIAIIVGLTIAAAAPTTMESTVPFITEGDIVLDSGQPEVYKVFKIFLFIVIAYDVLFIIIAILKVKQGKEFKYPITIRFIR